MSGRDQDSRIAFALATWFGVGRARSGPGTAAALTILPLHWLMTPAPPALEWVAAMIVTVAGVWAGHAVAASLDDHDPRIVVIDEAAGAWIALLIAHGHGVAGDLAAVGLFRLFDIFKPWPVIAMERLRHAGLAIMLDDVVAGVMAGIVVWWF